MPPYAASPTPLPFGSDSIAPLFPIFSALATGFMKTASIICYISALLRNVEQPAPTAGSIALSRMTGTAI